VALIADMIRDCSRSNCIIMDPFVSSGTTMIEAERTGRQARLLELDPAYVDVGVRRWQRFTNDQAVHIASGCTFAEIEAARRNAAKGENSSDQDE
jgi:DNA modification methylase